MTLSTVSRTKAIVNKYGFKFKKGLGQNFLIDEGVLQTIIQAADLVPGEAVVEIGPGIGTLTEWLAGEEARVLAVELDRGLLPILAETVGSRSNVKVINADVLKTNLDALVAEHTGGEFGPAGKSYKVVANLPYYITTPIIMRLLEEGYNLSSLVIMVQKEVAERLAASPGGKEYGAVTVAVQYYTIPELITIVPAAAFLPPPEVDSAVLRLSRRKKPPVQVTNEQNFFRVVKAAFAQRRKTLLNCLIQANLGPDRQEWSKILPELGIDPGRRGETLNLEEFAAIANKLGNQ